MQCSRPAVYESIWDVRVMLVWLYQAEVSALLGCEAGQIVELEVHEADGVLQVFAGVAAPVVDVVLALAAHGPDELDDGVVEVDGINCQSPDARPDEYANGSKALSTTGKRTNSIGRSAFWTSVTICGRYSAPRLKTRVR